MKDYNNNEYFILLKEWGDALIFHQVKGFGHNEFNGGILCPSCLGMHGRAADAMYPFVFLYSKTGHTKYYQAAQLLFDWVNANLKRHNKRLLNDANSTWSSTTVFYNIQLGELLLNLKEYINKDDFSKWEQSYLETSEIIYNEFYDNLYWNINYRVAIAASMAIAWKFTGKDEYREKAKVFAKIATNHISEEGIMYGEGKPTDLPSPRGFRPVDLGYNVEESLPNLAIYLKYIGEDKEVEDITLKSLYAHLEFMLPDGGWDNSWGSRCAKWSYWGSRTSDGCQGAFCYFADKDPVFFEAAHRNFELYRKCTIDGLLAGGVHHKQMNEPACVHHTFCHMKALVPLIECSVKRCENVLLPREKSNGIKNYSTMDIATASRAEWLVTISNDDFTTPDCYGRCSGGTVSMLYHKKLGVILAGGQNQYSLVEQFNMQVPQIYDNLCPFMRIESVEGINIKRSSYDYNAKITTSDKDGIITYKASGFIKDFKQNGNCAYQLIYNISGSAFSVYAKCEEENARFIIPVVALPEEKLTINGNTAEIVKGNHRIIIEGNYDIFHDTTMSDRLFHPWGGFSSAYLYMDMEKDKELTVKIRVE